MAVLMGRLMSGAFPELRFQPVDRRVRAAVGQTTVVDSLRTRLVWEPRRLVPAYAVPVADVAAELVPYGGVVGNEHPVRLGDATGVLDPRTPFTVHSTHGRSLSIRTPEGELDGAAFAPDDPDLEGYVVLDAGAFTQWWEEDEPVMGHPRDPYHRIDCLRSSRRVTISADGELLADSRRATMLFENPLTARYYLPRDDIRQEGLEASGLRTICPYKGAASYWSWTLPGRRLADIAWSYEEPLHDAAPVGGMVAFFTERLDLELDGVAVDRPVTPWS